MHKLRFKDTVVFLGDVALRLSNELNPIFPFPTTFLGDLSEEQRGKRPTWSGDWLLQSQ